MSFTKRAVAAAAFVPLLALSACTGSSGGSPSSPPSSSASKSGQPPVPAVNPLTGGKPNKNPVIAVKIEDTALGRPQVGTNKADIVYVEQVEGGLTRLMAIFNTSLVNVEPVRSVRPSDPELALQFGHIIFVASGGSHAGKAPLMASPLKKVIGDAGGAEFTRDPSRNAPENLVVNLKKVAKMVKGPTAKSIGLTWSSAMPAGKSTKGTYLKTQVGGTAVAFRWNAKTHRYMRLINGAIQHTADHSVIDTPNVIVQFCKVTTYAKDRDVNGNPAKFTKTIGTGRAVVYRDGKRIDGTWSRTSVNSGTILKTKDGKVIPLSPGGAWFVLAANGAPLK